MGHGFNDNDVIKHDYWGDKVIDDLKTMAGWEEGYIILSKPLRAPILKTHFPTLDIMSMYKIFADLDPTILCRSYISIETNADKFPHFECTFTRNNSRGKITIDFSSSEKKGMHTVVEENYDIGNGDNFQDFITSRKLHRFHLMPKTWTDKEEIVYKNLSTADMESRRQRATALVESDRLRYEVLLKESGFRGSWNQAKNILTIKILEKPTILERLEAAEG